MVDDYFDPLGKLFKICWERIILLESYCGDYATFRKGQIVNAEHSCLQSVKSGTGSIIEETADGVLLPSVDVSLKPGLRTLPVVCGSTTGKTVAEMDAAVGREVRRRHDRRRH